MRKNKLFSSVFVLFSLCFSLSFSGCNLFADKKDCSIKFSWWGNQNRHEYTQNGLKRFEALNPSIKVLPEYDTWVSYEKNFGNWLSSGTCADVMQINFDWLLKYSPDGSAFYDLNRLTDFIDLYSFTLDDLSYGTVNGKLNAIPISFNTAIPVYDKNILDQHGFKIPSTWEELFLLGKTLKKDDMSVFTISNRHLFFLALAWFEQTFSKKMFSEDGKLNISAREIGDIFEFVKRLVDENVIYSPTKGFKLSAVRNKKVAGAFVWCSETSIVLTEMNAHKGKCILGNFITTPQAKESGWYLKPASMYAIKKDCQHPEEAAKLVDFLLNNEEFALLQKSEKGVPVSNRALSALMKSKQLESMQYKALMKIRFNSGDINIMHPVMENSDMLDSFAENAFAYIEGNKTKIEAEAGFWSVVHAAMLAD